MDEDRRKRRREIARNLVQGGEDIIQILIKQELEKSAGEKDYDKINKLRAILLTCKGVEGVIDLVDLINEFDED